MTLKPRCPDRSAGSLVTDTQRDVAGFGLTHSGPVADRPDGRVLRSLVDHRRRVSADEEKRPRPNAKPYREVNSRVSKTKTLILFAALLPKSFRPCRRDHAGPAVLIRHGALCFSLSEKIAGVTSSSPQWSAEGSQLSLGAAPERVFTSYTKTLLCDLVCRFALAAQGVPGRRSTVFRRVPRKRSSC